MAPARELRPSPGRSGRAAVALLLAAAVLWSTSGIGIKELAQPPMAIAGWRALFALPVLAGALALRARRAGGGAFEGARTPWVWAGAVSYAVMGVGFVAATKLTTAANAVFIQYTSIAYVALASWPLLRERVTPRDAAACAGVLLGLALFFRGSIAGRARLGDALAVVSSFGATGLPLALRADVRRAERAGRSRAALVSPVLAMAAGDALIVGACLPAMASSPPHGVGAWALVVALGVGQVGLPYVLYALAVPYVTALESAVVPTLEPLLNPVWVFLGTGERPDDWALAGAACVVAGILVQASKAARDPLRRASRAS